MGKKTRQKKHTRAIVIIAAVVIAAVMLFLVYAYIGPGSQGLPPGLSGTAPLANNYTSQSNQCTRQGVFFPTSICTEVLYRVSNITSLPNRVVLARYTFRSNSDASNYMYDVLNGTNYTTVNASNIRFAYLSIPFINGQTVFTAYYTDGSTSYSASSLFNYSQPTLRARQITIGLVSSLANYGK